MPTVDLWKTFQDIRDKLKTEPEFAAAFDKNPGQALRRAGLDVKVPATPNSKETNLSSLFAKMTHAERRATIDAVLGGRPLGPGSVAVVTPVANANVAANANAGANANALANANANANTNTKGAGVDPADFPGDLLRLRISDAVRSGAVSRQLEKFHLSPARQSALFKAMLTDPTAIVSSKAAPEGMLLVSRQSYKGVTFEIEALARGGDLMVTKSRIVR